MLSMKDFFSIHDFEHSSLWRNKALICDALLHLESYLKSYSHKINIQIPDGVYFKNKDQITIGEGTIIEPGVLIEGPCIIGKNCLIRHGAFLREFVILGNDCVVGHCSELKSSILMNGAVAAHLCYIGDSIIGPSVNLGAGVKCANLRLDRREISLDFQGTKTKTGLKKLGAILGESVQIGCNCVLNPGTLVGEKSVIYPLLNIGGTIPPMHQVRSDLRYVVEPKAERLLQSLMMTEPEKV